MNESQMEIKKADPLRKQRFRGAPTPKSGCGSPTHRTHDHIMVAKIELFVFDKYDANGNEIETGTFTTEMEDISFI